MSEVADWSAIAAENDSPSPNGFPEGMPPSGVNNACREVMAAVKRAFNGLATSGTVYDSARLNGQLAAFYLARANHTGSNNADTLQSFNASYFLDRNNHTGTNNASQLNSQPASFYLDRNNHTGTQAAVTAKVYHGRINGSGGSIRLPSGWTSSRLAVGAYQIDHTLGVDTFSVVPICIRGLVGAQSSLIGTPTSSSFQYQLNDGDGDRIDVDSHFILVLD